MDCTRATVDQNDVELVHDKVQRAARKNLHQLTNKQQETFESDSVWMEADCFATPIAECFYQGKAKGGLNYI